MRITAAKLSTSRRPMLRMGHLRRRPRAALLAVARGRRTSPRYLFPVAELVSHPEHGLDVARLARIGLQLVAQVLDVAVDRPLVALERRTLHAVEELLAGPDAAGPLRQRLQQRELARCQRHHRPLRRTSWRSRSTSRSAWRSSAPGAREAFVRRRTARTRATSSFGSN